MRKTALNLCIPRGLECGDARHPSARASQKSKAPALAEGSHLYIAKCRLPMTDSDSHLRQLDLDNLLMV